MPPDSSDSHLRGWRKALFLSLALGVFLYVLIRTAWVCDDAYIIFRTVDNFANGFGPRWNVDERVQAYTCPLWMFVLTSVYACSREIFYTSITLSIIFSL